MRLSFATRTPVLFLAALFLTLFGCSSMQTGSSAAKTEATGSAGGANSQNANSKLEHCDAALGTVSVEEDQSADWYGALRGQHLGSTIPVIKLIVQQSNCFVIVNHGAGQMNNYSRERALQESGELRSNSKFHKGQLVAADYTMSPSVTFSNNDAGGISGALFGKLGPLSAVAGSMKFKEASTVLALVDNRSSVQLAAAEGSARNVDFGGLGAGFGSALAGVGGGYSNTAEGKVVVAAFVDAYNNMVKAVRQYKAQNVKGGLGAGGNLKVQE